MHICAGRPIVEQDENNLGRGTPANNIPDVTATGDRFLYTALNKVLGLVEIPGYDAHMITNHESEE
jgi:hypothetical protein